MTGQTIDLNIDGLASEYVRVGALQLHGLRRGRVYSITEDGMERARDILKAIIPILD
jgi:DNA-binding PadR family transcriptional regulator